MGRKTALSARNTMSRILPFHWEKLLPLVEAAQSDIGRFPPEAQVTAEQFLVDLQAIVDAGPEAFDTVAVGTVLVGVSFLVATLRTLECDPFLADG